jgi:hypothetical protein
LNNDLPGLNDPGVNSNYVPATSKWSFSLRAEQGPSKEEVCEKSRIKTVDNLIKKVEKVFGEQVRNSKVNMILMKVKHSFR